MCCLSHFIMKVNFSPEIITLTKEARNMKWLVSRVPLAIVNKAHTARQMYPYAISLIENVATYKRICERVAEKRTCALLVAGMKKDIQSILLDMSTIVWDSYKLESSVQKFADSIYSLREKVDELITVETSIDQQLKELDACAYDEARFAEILYEIQKSIDHLNLKGFSNLPQWVVRLDEDVAKRFAQRLGAAIKVWIGALLDKKKMKKKKAKRRANKNNNSNNNKQQLTRIASASKTPKQPDELGLTWVRNIFEISNFDNQFGFKSENNLFRIGHDLK